MLSPVLNKQNVYEKVENIERVFLETSSDQHTRSRSASARGSTGRDTLSPDGLLIFRVKVNIGDRDCLRREVDGGLVGPRARFFWSIRCRTTIWLRGVVEQADRTLANDDVLGEACCRSSDTLDGSVTSGSSDVWIGIQRKAQCRP